MEFWEFGVCPFIHLWQSCPVKLWGLLTLCFCALFMHSVARALPGSRPWPSPGFAGIKGCGFACWYLLMNDLWRQGLALTVNSRSCYIPSQPSGLLCRENAARAGQQQHWFCCMNFAPENECRQLQVSKEIGITWGVLGFCLSWTITQQIWSFFPLCHVSSRQGGIFDCLACSISISACQFSICYLF